MDFNGFRLMDFMDSRIDCYFFEPVSCGDIPSKIKINERIWIKFRLYIIRFASI